MACCCSYVEQFENHSTRVTVRESLLFSARLRLDESTVTMQQVGGSGLLH